MKQNNQHIASPLRRFWNGFYTKAELSRWAEQLNDPATRGETEEEIDQLWHNHTAASPTPSQYEAYKREAQTLLNRIHPQPTVPIKKKKLALVLKIAAVWIVGLLMAGAVHQLITKQDSKAIAQQIIRVENGKKRSVVLPDGSQLYLNAGTTLSYPTAFTNGERRIQLDGEAYMKIQRKEEHPFVIETKAATVRVLGTSFNLKTYTEDKLFNLCVETGKVEVACTDAIITLTANQQVSIDCESGEFIKERQQAKHLLNWQKGALYFHRTPLYAVVNQIRRLYNVSIKADASVDVNERITGEHDNPNVSAVINSICLATGLAHRTEENTIIIYKEKE